MNAESLQREATDYLQQLLRIDTTSPPGNEIAAIRWLDAILQKEGLRTTIVEGAPGRANLVCRFATGGTEGPLLLSSHVDVVPAESQHWTHPPFGGVIADGCIWGRGAIDMKSMTIYGLTLPGLGRVAAHVTPYLIDGFHWGVATFAEVVRRFVC